MTWIPCGFCGQAPCLCQWRAQNVPPNQLGWTGTLKFTPTETPRLSDDDVERIAKRVAELLREAK